MIKLCFFNENNIKTKENLLKNINKNTYSPRAYYMH